MGGICDPTSTAMSGYASADEDVDGDEAAPAPALPSVAPATGSSALSSVDTAASIVVSCHNLEMVSIVSRKRRSLFKCITTFS